ncbi:MAG: Re/Si-specific NAD(P)(+) transhydrogenase subunit alpha [Sphingomonadaceae bacterium]
MKIAVLKETAPGERRVAATPETAKKLAALGATVAVEAGAGQGADIPDAEFVDAGATVGSRAEVLAGARLVMAIQGPDPEGLPAGALLAAALNPYQSKERLQAYAAAQVDALALEFVPRITRAQSMDILSSQANLAGYKAVIDAAAAYGRAFPMMMTAAGTVPAARVFVMGVGVAGLQAIATAKRLGAVVSATDVRLATKEQILSLGGKPIFIEDEETKAAETAGGYAKEMSDAYKAKQAALVSETVAKQDIVITTALIPGRPAPRLVTAAQVATMKPGSVIVDMSVVQGGNVEGSKADETVVTDNGVTILGFSNYPSRMASTASSLFARNLLNFVQTFWDREKGMLVLPEDDEIVKGAMVVKGGTIIHPALQA